MPHGSLKSTEILHSAMTSVSAGAELAAGRGVGRLSGGGNRRRRRLRLLEPRWGSRSGTAGGRASGLGCSGVGASAGGVASGPGASGA